MSTRSKRAVPPKRSPRSPRLSEQEVFAAALALIEAHGVEALAMRGLAQKLGVTAMAIYHYVPSKEALLDRLAESLLATVQTPEPSSRSWEAQLRAYALSIWDCLSPYPGLSRSVLERPPIKAFGRLNMYVLSLLRAAGFDQARALLAMLSVQTQLGGALAAQARFAGPSRRRRRRRAAGARVKVTPEAQQMIEHLRSLDARAWMEFGLDALIAGLRQQLASEAVAAGAPRSIARA